MEKLKNIVYRFEGFARSEDGGLSELSVAISAPEDSGKGDSVCLLYCSYIDATALSIYGVDHDQALELSRRFVEASLEHMNVTLVDAEDKPIDLPPVPKAETLS